MTDTDHRSQSLRTLMLGALGVVYGDIGTSPLYALQTVFSIDHGDVKPTEADVFGVISMVFWSVTVIVSIKYVVFILRADNDGEGGIMALAHLTRKGLKPGGRRYALTLVLGVLGASLFYGDSVITPSISVLSAVEGVSVSAPGLEHWVLPIGIVIITALFATQRFGTHVVGRAFGPVMVLWFLTLAALGIPHIARDPQILRGLSPTYAIAFVVSNPLIAFVAMGAVVLTITGAEALYADMGHFGRSPIRSAWFFMVFPSLTINYLGQAALILRDPRAIDNPFYRLAPSWGQWPLVVLATCATVIASQAVISGAFSVTRQAERLGFLPRLTVRQTSEHSGGQIYLPAVNWIIFATVITLMVSFRSSSKLATAYGLAVTGTFLFSTSLFLVFAESAWRWARWKVVLVGLLFLPLELTFFIANVTKIGHGGWLPLVIAVIVGTVMFTWKRGQTIVTKRRQELEGPLQPFLDELRSDPPMRVPGTAVFLHPNKQTAPLALRENASFNKVIHQNVLIVSTVSENVPFVRDEDRIEVDDLGDPWDQVTHITLHFGFKEDQDVPAGLRLAQEAGVEFDPVEIYYFLSRIAVQTSRDDSMPAWRKRIFVGMAHNAATPVQYFRLPEDRTVVMGANVLL
nr:potassium transporter Kup [Metallococcus carri]